MRTSADDRGRPVTIRTASTMSLHDTTSVAADLDADARTRCRRCRHPLYAATSVRLELGPICRRIQLAEVAA